MKMYKDNGYYVIEYKPLNIVVYTKTEAEAMKQLKDEIDILWNAYVLEDDDNLTEGAIKLKRKLMDIAKGGDL